MVKQANDTVYGLAAAIFTQNINRAIETAHKIQAGTTWINCYHEYTAQVPFGGYKQSGIGREMAKYALDQYVHYGSITIGPVCDLFKVTPMSRPFTSTWASKCKESICKGSNGSLCYMSWLGATTVCQNLES